MEKLKILFLSMFLSLALSLCILPGAVLEVQAVGEYSQVNMFTDPYDIKGMQGARGIQKNDYERLNHSLTNIWLDTAIFSPDSDYAKNGWAVAYEFEGEMFYFTPNPTGMGLVGICNGDNMSISAVFLLRWNDGSRDSYNNNTNFLIDASSRVPGYSYYAPNADLSTYGGRAIRAYWHYLMEWLESKGYHIDNFILGNEVNMPNHWHYSGSTNVNVVATKYADAFYYMYQAVREHTSVSRCSISIDHSWNHNDEGRGIGARSFLHVFHDRLEQHSSNVDWCVSAHLYPAILTDARIWKHPYGLTTNSSNTAMVDGTNLSAMTNYIRDNFGSQHRVMLTEQGFTNNCGVEAQAACLAYTYYAAMYDPMVDCFLINAENAGSQLDFRIAGTLAGTVYQKIGNDNAEDQKWITDVCLPIIGASSWESIIPNFGNIHSIVIPENETLKVNDVKQLNATVAPSSVANQPLLWESSDTSVATVDASGVITAVGGGSATITAVAKYANHVTASCTVTVVQPIESIGLNATNLELNLSETYDLVATVFPDNATNKAILWQSSNEAVATVDQNGKVSTVGIGNALITAASCDGTGVSRSCTVTVVQPIEKIELSKETLDLFISETHKLVATVFPDNAKNTNLMWTSSDETVVTVDQKGSVKAVGIGTVTITATAQDGSGVSDSCVVTVSIEEGNPFYDVLSSQWYYKYIKSAFDMGFVSGKNKDAATGLVIFEPIASMARAEFVQVLHSMEDKPEVEYTGRFTDIPSGEWYTNAVLWAAENGITSGNPNGSFGKYANITREQLALMLMKYAILKGYDITDVADLSGYTDAAMVSSWAEEAISWAVANGIVSGTGDGKLNPQGSASRAEATTMLNGFYERFMKQPE